MQFLPIIFHSPQKKKMKRNKRKQKIIKLFLSSVPSILLAVDVLKMTWYAILYLIYYQMH